MHELIFRWEQAKMGARILQGYGDLTCIPVPRTIQDLPVTEVGPYCFSASEPGPAKEPSFFCRILYDDNFHPVREEAWDASDFSSYPALAGRYLEEIRLPASVEVLHNAAFYNCRKLHTLGIGPHISAIGSDVFTNCTKLEQLLYTGTEKEARTLSLILGRLEMDLLVSFISPGFPAGTKDQITGGLFFPEYYEWLDEVTPAHLFSRSINGEGFRMRKCFENGQLSYAKYDACFPNALKTESGKVLCRTALTRLRWPAGLSEESRILYESALRQHSGIGLDMVISWRDTDYLSLLSDIVPGTEALDLCIRKDWSEGSALLMEKLASRQNFAHKSFDFEDF